MEAVDAAVIITAFEFSAFASALNVAKWAIVANTCLKIVFGVANTARAGVT